MRWTAEQDAKLIQCIKQRMSSTEAATEMGITSEAARKRSVRLGVRFKRWREGVNRMKSDGHIPFDERSGELLRAAGVDI